MIALEHVTVRYGSFTALQDVSLELGAGEFMLVTGPSGCGKSTLARVLTGLIPHAIPASIEGSIQVAGLDIQKHSIPELAQRIGTVFQNPSSQLFHLSVEDEVAFGPQNLGLSPQEVKERVAWALEAVGLQEIRQCRPADLSGGQKQRVAIAAAVAMQPQVLVLDEPTASLDVPGTRAVIATLQALRRRYGITLVLIEHRLAEVARLADRAVLLDQGRVAASGTPGEVFENRDALRRLGLRRLVDEPLQSWETLLAPNGSPPGGDAPLLELRQVCAGYNRQAVLKDINLTLYGGEFAALVGDNGTGKSTLALVAAGLLKPSQGKVVYQDGKRPRPGLDISLLFQNPCDQLFTDSVDEEVAFGPQNYQVFRREQHEHVLREADLIPWRARRPAALSAGQQQRTALAACLALSPRLVILDEPTLGQDWGHLEQLMNFLTALNRQGTTILLITHDYKLVHRYAKRVILMTDGRITLDGRLRNHDR